MKFCVLRTDVRAHDLSVRRLLAAVQGPQGLAYEEKVLLISTPPKLAEMLDVTDDGANESDVRDAIAAAALADDWLLADSLARQYSLVVCLRCATDMQHRPGWRLYRLIPERTDCWGEVCGSCAVEMKGLSFKR
jgi:hypothetical protein